MSVRSARLFVFSDFAAHPDALEAYEALAGRAPAGSVAFVLRDRTLESRERALRGRQLCDVARAARQYFVVCDDTGLMRSLAADGLHLSSAAMPPAEARSQLPRDAWISRSAHDFERLTPDDCAALDALVVSPVWEARKGREALGEAGLRAWVIRARSAHSACGVIALGGGSGAVLERALELGAVAVAVMGAALSPARQAALLDALEESGVL